jgi:solute:Na+ symporter, SSS family
MSLSLAMLLLYVALQLGVGVYVSRRVRNEDDYLLAGRSLGPLLATSSVFATWFGAETCVGAAGQVYEHGPSAVSADPFGYGLALLLMGAVMAGPLWRRSVVTFADMFRDRYSPAVEKTVALLLIPGSLLWAAAQIRAFGTVLGATGGFSPELGMMIAIAIVLVYTASGGMLADAWTDVLQGAVLVGGLVVLLVVALPDLPLLAHAWSAPAPADAQGHGVLVTLNEWAIPILGSLFTQELLMRISSSRSASLARRCTIGAGCIYLVVGAIPVVLGLLARTVIPGIDEADTVLTVVSRHYLGEIGFVILSGALVSAILSTVDSALLACGSLVAHNLVPAAVREQSPTAPLRVARVSVVGLGLCAYGLAHLSDSVHALVQESSAFGSTGLLVIGIMALTSRSSRTGGGPAAALVALGLGVVSWVTLAHGLGSPVAYLGSLVCAAAGYGVATLLERRAARASAHGSADSHPR